MRVMTAVAFAALIAVPLLATSADAAQSRGGGGGGFHGGGGGGGFRGGVRGFSGGGALRGGGAFRGGARSFGGGGAFRGNGFRRGVGGFRGGAGAFARGNRFRGGYWGGDYGGAFIGGLGAGLLFDTIPGWDDDPFWGEYGYDPYFGYAPPPVVEAPYPSPYLTPPSGAPQQAWYYCADPQGYYPYVVNCTSAWQVIPAAPGG